jgi:hypothetical protein
MKINLIGILFFAVTCNSPAVLKDALIFIEKLQHDFGTIPYRNKTSHRFEFSNPGETPLVIYEVKASCGCTVPEWPKKPLNPGSKGEIIITYDAASPGTFYKEIKVHYNGSGSPVVLKIRGQVEYPDM